MKEAAQMTNGLVTVQIQSWLPFGASAFALK